MKYKEYEGRIEELIKLKGFASPDGDWTALNRLFLDMLKAGGEGAVARSI